MLLRWPGECIQAVDDLAGVASEPAAPGEVLADGAAAAARAGSACAWMRCDERRARRARRGRRTSGGPSAARRRWPRGAAGRLARSRPSPRSARSRLSRQSVARRIRRRLPAAGVSEEPAQRGFGAGHTAPVTQGTWEGVRAAPAGAAARSDTATSVAAIHAVRGCDDGGILPAPWCESVRRSDPCSSLGIGGGPPRLEIGAARGAGRCGRGQRAGGAAREERRSGRPDSNRGPSAPKADALPGCATPRRGRV